MYLEGVGFDDRFARDFESLKFEGVVPGRVIWQSAYSYRVQCEDGEIAAELSGKLKAGDLPAVGDWVAVRPAAVDEMGTILAILPRKSAFSRNTASKGVNEQVVAANIDEVLIVTDLDRDFNLRRIERYITLVYNSGASPVVVLNKTDLATDVEAVFAQTEAVSPGVPIFAVSAEKNQGIEQLKNHIGQGKTVAFLGSSGVGKSTIINCLLGEDRMEVGEVREADGKGRHTTTHRELVRLPGGGAVIDTPGMREIQVWGDEEGLVEAFPEIEALTAACRFRDCRHDSEKGCAVLEALDSGRLDKGRFESYMKLRGEFESLEVRKSKNARLEERREGKRFAKMVREVKRHNPKRKNRDS
ncbi:MAG: ribosome small subunit-dependent GTPase A [bacterium]|nr:ribosome small subunit-dependent GTPase A [bacterium]MDT8365160.1 ribosome small subunit-dependent GTPase A [bacterium]